ncbi:MAG: NAD(P)-binding protein, partial [Myxococcota bacterium]|nr:NAD(P)-binding protein [Myxococcota bacterium]
MSESDPGTRCLRVLNIALGLEEDEAVLRQRAAERAGIEVEAIRGLRLGRKALDARRRGRASQPRFVVHVDLTLDANAEEQAGTLFRSALRSGHAVWQAPPLRVATRAHSSLVGRRVAVIGAGPAGVFAAWALSQSGVEVDLLDRGPALPERSRSLARFLRTRDLNPEANLLFGEGGAGAYSDGKIYTRIDHPLEVPSRVEWMACGAPKEIAYDARAHIGTDRLHS